MFRIYVSSYDGDLSTGILVDTEVDAEELCKRFNEIDQDSDKEYIYKEVN